MKMDKVIVYQVAIGVFLGAVKTMAGGWDLGHATFYGDMGGSATMQGACGYGNLIDQGYGLQTAALSTALFNNGATCGACYQLQCYNSTYCKPGATITITATNFCPPNYSKTHDIWCNPPQKHFDLSMPMFVDIVTDYHVGVIPVMFRRVPCMKNGGIKFELQVYDFVLVYNVALVGDVVQVSVKGTGTSWLKLARNWGQVWHMPQDLKGQALSFRVTTSDGKMGESLDVVPANWQFGQTYEGKQF